jgi:exodeoxyribonuclease VII large subunit
MDAGYVRLLTERTSRLRSGAALLESYSYRGILERGFALVTDQDEQRITSAADAKAGMPVTVEFHDGKVDAIVGHGGVARKAEAGGTGKSRKAGPKAGQGVLF